MGAPLIQLLSPGTVLIAAGQRLGRHLAQQHARECRAAGMVLWETPAILTPGAWFGNLWQAAIESAADRRLLLTPVQEAALWERIVVDSRREQLLAASSTARLAAQAWKLLQEWRLPAVELARAGSEDVAAFAGWAEAFDAQCRGQRWLDAARLPDALRELIGTKQVALPTRVILAGFDEITPQFSDLLDTLRAHGCDVSMVEPDETASHAQCAVLPSSNDEILAAAEWARAKLMQNPQARIGILAPDLAGQGHALRRAFDDLLLPDAVLPGHEEATRPYNISFGEPLAEQPLVATALSALGMARGSFPLAELSALLTSPFLVGGESEITRRATLDVEIRSNGDVELDIAVLARALQRHDGCPILAERVARFRELAAALPRRQAPSRWVPVFAQLLAALGWPGDRSRSSSEHQMLKAWRDLLGNFAALDMVLPVLGFTEALARLRRLAQEAVFQRETPETPVQILGVLEASGFEFDALWVMGLHDEVWPAAARPNPFLPVALQRQRRLPHASVERELEFCARFTDRLCHSAADVVMSYPRQEEDRELRPSPLIRDLPPFVPAQERAMRYRDVIHAAARLEVLRDELAPALPVDTNVSGGTALFRAQSACPFRAFAEFRLKAKQFPEPEAGLSPADRGKLLHDVLAQVWQQLGAHEALMASDENALVALVTPIVAGLVERLAQQRPATLTPRIVVLECERLTALVLGWLALEKSRAPFVVRREESTVSLQVGALRTDARMDRVDELSDGTFAVIDYKTGEARTADWFGERPAEPQLPLYALYGMPRERVGALLFGRLRRAESKFVGIARTDGTAPGVDAHAATRLAAEQGPWETLFDKWELRFTALSDEHRRGVARVSPRDNKVCDQCHLHAFCRMYERRVRLVDVGEGSEE